MSNLFLVANLLSRQGPKWNLLYSVSYPKITDLMTQVIREVIQSNTITFCSFLTYSPELIIFTNNFQFALSLDDKLCFACGCLNNTDSYISPCMYQ